MRLIDADALMAYCNNLKIRTVDANDIARFPTAYGWISVEDKLPDEDNNYLVNVKLPYGRDPWYVCISIYRHVHPDKFGCFGIEKVGFTHGGVVTHWMPLPEAKKE